MNLIKMFNTKLRSRWDYFLWGRLSSLPFALHRLESLRHR